MLDFSPMNIIRRLILLITGILIAMRCFVPIGRHIPEMIDKVFHRIGIAVIGGVLFYILGGRKQRKD